jgi:predicted  nucleic acid-binding Zn-ribbon protein
MGRVKDLVYTGVYDMSYEDDLLRENNILRKNIKDLQEQLNKAHQRIKHLTDNKWSEERKDIK